MQLKNPVRNIHYKPQVNVTNPKNQSMGQFIQFSSQQTKNGREKAGQKKKETKIISQFYQSYLTTNQSGWSTFSVQSVGCFLPILSKDYQLPSFPGKIGGGFVKNPG